MAILLEFIGPPGAGKTTLLPAAAEALADRGLSVFTVAEAARPFARRTWPGAAVARLAPKRWRGPLLWQTFYRLSVLDRFRFCAGHKRLLRLVLASQWRRPAAADARQRRVLYWYFRHAGYYEFLRKRAAPGEVLLFDEGFLHRVVQLFASVVERPESQTIKPYLDLLPRPDLTIAIMAPAEVCVDRIYSRGLWNRFGDKTPEEVSRFVSHSHRAVTLALDAVVEAGWPVLEVENSAGDPAQAAALLQEKLARYPLPSGAAPARITGEQAVENRVQSAAKSTAKSAAKSGIRS
jgi:thymidylate kinase